jgi:hypothetical protein
MLIWHTTVWKIWEARNDMIFSDKILSLEDLGDDIKVTSWRWLLVSKKDVPCLYYEWFSNPLRSLLCYAFTIAVWWVEYPYQLMGQVLIVLLSLLYSIILILPLKIIITIVCTHLKLRSYKLTSHTFSL